MSVTAGSRCLATAVALWATLAAANAQEGGGPSLFGTSIQSLFGQETGPQTYASPSARELLPEPPDVGVPALSGLSRLEPIALPEQPLFAPEVEMPHLPAFLPSDVPALEGLRPAPTLTIRALLSEDGDYVPNGLDWRLFAAIPRLDGELQLVASSTDETARFSVPQGTYYLHVSFGGAGLAKRIDFSGIATQETVVLDAGGLKLAAVAGQEKACDPSRLRFDVYELEDNVVGDLVASSSAPGEVLRLNAGDYRVVSRYGSVNATVTTEVTVTAGELTEATLRHDAAVVTLKLVREDGGEAIADTAWTVTTTSGDPVRESVGAFSTMVLAAGHYVITARNREKVFQRAYEVKPGEDDDVEVLTSDVLLEGVDGMGGGG